MALLGRTRSLLQRGDYTIVLQFDAPVSIRDRASGRKAGLRGIEAIFRMLRPIVFMGIISSHLVLPGLVYVFGVRGAGLADALEFVPSVDGALFSPRSMILLLVAVAVAVAVHELAHAVLLIGNGVQIRGFGVRMFVLIPSGATVKFAADEWKTLSTDAKATILSAGISANLAVSFGAFLALTQYPSRLLFWVATVNLTLGTWNCLPLGDQDGLKLFLYVLWDEVEPTSIPFDRPSTRLSCWISHIIVTTCLILLIGIAIAGEVP